MQAPQISYNPWVSLLRSSWHHILGSRPVLCAALSRHGKARIGGTLLARLHQELFQVLQRKILHVARLPQVDQELGDTALEFREAFCDNFCGERLLQRASSPGAHGGRCSCLGPGLK